MDNHLIVLQHFFTVDNRIKKEMYNNVPPTNAVPIDKDSLCKYTNNLYESLIYIFSELKCVALDIFGIDSVVLKKITELEIKIKQDFYSCGLNINKLRLFYEKNISNMSEIFIDSVKDNCVGYHFVDEIIDDPVSKINTINEMLHLIHSYIINNEEVLQAIPTLAKKTNNYDYSITLRGVSTTLFNQLYQLFPLDLDVGVTDMVCLSENKLLMMVRDRGHALTIEITLNGNIARMEYFIPKLCNIDMINALPGVNKVNKDSIGASGVIETEINHLPESLYNFIMKVPMDSDMIFEGIRK